MIQSTTSKSNSLLKCSKEKAQKNQERTLQTHKRRWLKAIVKNFLVQKSLNLMTQTITAQILRNNKLVKFSKTKQNLSTFIN